MIVAITPTFYFVVVEVDIIASSTSLQTATNFLTFQLCNDLASSPLFLSSHPILRGVPLSRADRTGTSFCRRSSSVWLAERFPPVTANVQITSRPFGRKQTAGQESGIKRQELLKELCTMVQGLAAPRAWHQVTGASESFREQRAGFLLFLNTKYSYYTAGFPFFRWLISNAVFTHTSPCPPLLPSFLSPL
jgi:hypothetical protein